MREEAAAICRISRCVLFFLFFCGRLQAQPPTTREWMLLSLSLICRFFVFVERYLASVGARRGNWLERCGGCVNKNWGGCL